MWPKVKVKKTFYKKLKVFSLRIILKQTYIKSRWKALPLSLLTFLIFKESHICTWTVTASWKHSVFKTKTEQLKAETFYKTLEPDLIALIVAKYPSV